MVDFRILGPLEVVDETGPLLLGGQKQRSVLALLLLDAPRPVSTDRLIDALWGEQPPRTAPTSLQNFISQLRKTVGSDVLVTRPPGYALTIRPEQLDLERFRQLVAEARSVPEAAERAGILQRALDLWRGPPLADVEFEAFAQSEITRLDEERLAALEERRAALERQFAVVGRLSQVANGQNPERLTLQRFVLRSLLQEVLAVASRQLSEMSRGRYSLQVVRPGGEVRSAGGLELEQVDGGADEFELGAQLLGS